VRNVAADAANNFEVDFILFFFLLQRLEMPERHGTARNCVAVHHSPPERRDKLQGWLFGLSHELVRVLLRYK
jgi:hypothetical protein